MEKRVIVSRHTGAVEWLRQQGIEGKVISHATVDDVCDKDVVGNLPLALAAEAASVTVIGFDVLPAEARGRDLSLDEMREYGAHLEKFQVTRL